MTCKLGLADSTLLVHPSPSSLPLPSSYPTEAGQPPSNRGAVPLHAVPCPCRPTLSRYRHPGFLEAGQFNIHVLSVMQVFGVQVVANEKIPKRKKRVLTIYWLECTRSIQVL